MKQVKFLLSISVFLLWAVDATASSFVVPGFGSPYISADFQPKGDADVDLGLEDIHGPYFTVTDAGAGDGHIFLEKPYEQVRDVDWQLEVHMRVISLQSSTFGSLALGIFGVPYSAIYLDVDRITVIGPTTQVIHSYSLDVTELHTYKIIYHANNAGSSDDSFDVYVDGERVITGVAVSSTAQTPYNPALLILGNVMSTASGTSFAVYHVSFSNESCEGC